MTLKLPNASRSAADAAVLTRFDAGPGPGTMQIRSGAPPASAEDAATGTLLATVTLADPAFGAPVDGSGTIIDPGPVTGTAAGTATWFRGLDSTGAKVLDGSVGPTGTGEDLELNTTTISVGVNFDITGGTVTMPAGG